MKRPFRLALCALVLGSASVTGVGVFSPLAAQSAAEQAARVETKTFAIEKMTCAMCPITVRKAIERVDGVRSVEVDFDAKTATVVYDPSITQAEAIAAASSNAGYPASVKG
ncbi:heavy-metal-associated domain-containing protein [Oceanibacterium hippocampi]|uniref:Mercuric transport protein periplasmic component n=1 Tax=Oceanibacterium hippocampi TaxID=745714 RepID=A0A1Y5TW42_9PROT|nr:cation transporter [Oceanibacterium hippocampi]SLN71314.1 Mercuric transport protein periplasmic component precursor [Oceanibacterium hippocampi]